MSTINTTLRLTTVDRWLAPHAAALISFAEQDAVFALTLATIVQEENWSIVEGPMVPKSKYLHPVDFAAAEDILDWIMYELATHPEARVSRSLLTEWTRTYEAPQDLIWGLALTDTFGPTVTGMPNKRKQVSQLQIIIHEQWATKLSAVELSESTHTLSQEVIALELRKAGGKIGSLHPDTAEWCMGGAATKLYETSAKTLDRLHDSIIKDELHHRTITKDKRVVAIAVSPSVRDTLVEETLN